MINHCDLEIEAAVRKGTIRALRRRAKVQAARAADGEIPAGENFPNVIVRSGESVLARGLSETLSAIADELERESPK